MFYLNRILFILLLFCGLNLQPGIEILPNQEFVEANKATYAKLQQKGISRNKLWFDFKTYNSVVTEGLNSSEDMPEWEATLKRYREQWVLWTLCEINAPHCDRETFEKCVVDEIIRRAPTNRSRGSGELRPINYVSFASGCLLQDFYVGSQILARQIPVNIHIIDSMYSEYVTLIERFFGGKITAFQESEHFTDKVLLRTHERCSQLANWFAFLCPEKKWKFFVYKNIDDYLKSCADFDNKADVIASACYGFPGKDGGPNGWELFEQLKKNNDKAEWFSLVAGKITSSKGSLIPVLDVSGRRLGYRMEEKTIPDTQQQRIIGNPTDAITDKANENLNAVGNKKQNSETQKSNYSQYFSSFINSTPGKLILGCALVIGGYFSYIKLKKWFNT